VASDIADRGARTQHSRHPGGARRPAVYFWGCADVAWPRGNGGSRGVPARGARAERQLVGFVAGPEDTQLSDQPLWRGGYIGEARRGRGVPLAAEPVPCPDGQIARDELLDLPRISLATSRRRSGRRGRQRWQRPVRLVRACAGLRPSVPPRLPHVLGAQDSESCMPPMQEVTASVVPEGRFGGGAGPPS